MEIKKRLKLSSSEFFYDLFDGGYLDPTKICKDKVDAEKVQESIEIINEFRASIEETYPNFNS